MTTMTTMTDRVRALSLAALLVVASPGCIPGATAEDVAVTAAITTANAARLTIETAETTALTAYRAAQLVEVERMKAESGTRPEAIAAVDAVRTKWKPVWESLDALQTAQMALVSAITAYESGKAAAAAVAAASAALVQAEHGFSGLLKSARGER